MWVSFFNRVFLSLSVFLSVSFCLSLSICLSLSLSVSFCLFLSVSFCLSLSLCPSLSLSFSLCPSMFNLSISLVSQYCTFTFLVQIKDRFDIWNCNLCTLLKGIKGARTTFLFHILNFFSFLFFQFQFVLTVCYNGKWLMVTILFSAKKNISFSIFIYFRSGPSVFRQHARTQTNPAHLLLKTHRQMTGHLRCFTIIIILFLSFSLCLSVSLYLCLFHYFYICLYILPACTYVCWSFVILLLLCIKLGNIRTKKWHFNKLKIF